VPLLSIARECPRPLASLLSLNSAPTWERKISRSCTVVGHRVAPSHPMNKRSKQRTLRSLSTCLRASSQLFGQHAHLAGSRGFQFWRSAGGNLHVPACSLPAARLLQASYSSGLILGELESWRFAKCGRSRSGCCLAALGLRASLICAPRGARLGLGLIASNVIEGFPRRPGASSSDSSSRSEVIAAWSWSCRRQPGWAGAACCQSDVALLRAAARLDQRRH